MTNEEALKSETDHAHKAEMEWYETGKLWREVLTYTKHVTGNETTINC